MNVTRRDLFRMPLAAPMASLAQRKAPPNLLMIAVDDLNNRIGCYGDVIVKTPNIDRLAHRGVRFVHAYCNYPLCNPTRTSLLSGKRPETTRIFNNNVQPRTYLGEAVFLPGYYCGHRNRICRLEASRPGSASLTRQGENPCANPTGWSF